MKYELVQTINGQMIKTDGDMDDIFAAFKVRGFTFVGLREDNPGRIKLRPELVGAPMFRELLGPMFNGPGVVRYEDPETYNMLST
jgi:hypothetical protein